MASVAMDRDESGRRCTRRIFIVGASSFLFAATLGCEQRHQRRPYGYIRVGTVNELISGKDLSDKWLWARRDAEGLYVLSTLCTLDLEPLVRISPEGFSCPNCSSEYSIDGEVKKGPSQYPLPYYELKLDQGEIGGPRDTVYVYVGVEKPRDYRLLIP